MKRKTYLSALLTAILTVTTIIGSLGSPKEADASITNFITRSGNLLKDGSATFRFAGVNADDILRSQWGGGKDLPTDWEVESYFKRASQMGVQVIRTWVLSVGSTTRYYQPMITAPGTYNESAFKVLDKVLQYANQYGIRLIIPLVDNWNSGPGGIANWAGFRGKSSPEFFTDTTVRNDFKGMISYLVNRTNTYTNTKYKDDKAIMAWETGNELPINNSAVDSWNSAIAAYLKSVDSNHLVMDGIFSGSTANMAIESNSLNDPNIDIVSDHCYGCTSVTNLGGSQKPFVIGELGWHYLGNTHLEGVSNTNWLKARMDEALNNGVAGINLWAMKLRNEGGSVAFHNGHDSLAFDWPGSANTLYDEIGTMNMFRDHVYAMRGLSVPALPLPEAPVLEPITSVHQIRWKAGIGSASYTIERSAGSSGPWAAVGSNLTDNITPFIPFDDTSAVAGQTYYYRMKGINGAGSSAYSNTVGPITADGGSVVKEWRFYDSSAQAPTSNGWSNYGGTTGFEADNAGYLRFGASNTDPAIWSADNLGINISSATKLQVTMRNGTSGTTGTIFFATNASQSLDGAKSKTFTVLAKSNTFTTYVIDMSTVSGWTGTLKRLRVDPVEGFNDGDFGIESIRIINPSGTSSSSGRNLADSKPVTVSSTVSWTSNYSGANLSNGNTGDFWTSQLLASGTQSEWAYVDLGAQQAFNRIVLYPRINNGQATGFPSGFKLQGSNDASAWTDLTTQTGFAAQPNGTGIAFNVGSQSYRYVRFLSTNASPDPAGDKYVQLSEMEVYQSALSTSKAVTVSSTVSWSTAYGGANTTNGDTTDFWTSKLLGSTGQSEWAYVDLGSAQSFKRIIVYPRINNGQATSYPTGFKLQGSNDASSWTDLNTQSGFVPQPNGTGISFNIGSQTYRYVRFLSTQASQDPAGDYYVQLAEIEVDN